ncbi:hypothetical protein C8R43DRAFT_1000649 [Mycena crocata]|nr:hypothetical protein C8R43DRAFT_1000649 [Mycena crocata]
MPPTAFSKLTWELDIIFSVFFFCDIATLLYTGQTCKRLQKLAFRKNVWLTVVDGLRRKLFLDPDIPELHGLSTAQLIALVKRILTGPESWTPRARGCPFTPEVSKHIEVRTRIRVGSVRAPYENQATLYKGGRYFLYRNLDALECWNVAEPRLVWTYTPPNAAAHVFAFAADDQTLDDPLVIMICGIDSSEEATTPNYIEIVELDLHRGKHNTLFMCRTPDTMYEDPFSSPVLCGDIAAVSIGSVQDTFLIINWKAHTVFMLAAYQRSQSEVVLIPGHILLKTRTNRQEDELNLIHSEEAFRVHGVPANDRAMDYDDTVAVDRVPKMLSHRIRPTVIRQTQSNGWPMHDKISVHADPLRQDTFRIWVYLSDADRHDDSSFRDAALYSYELKITASQPPHLRERTSVQALRRKRYRNIAYSGHTQAFDPSGYGKQQILPPPPMQTSTVSAEVDLDCCGLHVDVSSYSGALTHCPHGSVIIQYYR